MPRDVAVLGQVFTPPAIVSHMLGLLRNRGPVLEPSCGDGAFLKHLHNAVGIELDARQAPPGALTMDFFAYPESGKFDTVIGNPPYVRYRDISPATMAASSSSLLALDNAAVYMMDAHPAPCQIPLAI